MHSNLKLIISFRFQIYFRDLSSFSRDILTKVQRFNLVCSSTIRKHIWLRSLYCGVKIFWFL